MYLTKSRAWLRRLPTAPAMVTPPPVPQQRRAHAADAIAGARRAREFLCALTGPLPVNADIETTPIHDAISAWHGPITTSQRLPKAAH